MTNTLSNKIIFSIVLCTYNRGMYIKKCLDSLIGLNFPKDRYEIIVVDDGSTDSTKEIIKTYPVRLIEHAKNKGLAAARNTGLKYARGKIYVCFDDDCYADKDWLKKLYEAYEYGWENIIGISGFIKLQGKSKIIDKYMNETGYANPSPAYYGKSKNPFKRFVAYIKNMFLPSTQRLGKITEVGEIWGANCSFPIKILKEINGWDENLSGVEDTDLCDRIKKRFKSYNFFCVRDAILYHEHKLSLFKLLEKPYGRGKSILKFYLQNSKIPPIFPFPIGVLLLFTIVSIRYPLYGLASIIILPQIFYSWWLLKAIKRRKIYLLTFAYLQFGYELFSVLGLIKGFVQIQKYTTSRKLLTLLFIYGLLVNVFVLKNINFYFLREIFSSIYLLILPGLLVSWITRIKYKNIWEFFPYIVGISLTTLMILGLGINFSFSYINIGLSYITSLQVPGIWIAKPLSMQPILISLDILLTIFWTYTFLQNNPVPLEKNKINVSIKDIFLVLVAITFPILSLIGAISLNNNQTNIFTMIMLGLIALFIMLLTILRDKISKHIFPLSLFTIALSLLFMTSSRDWYIAGHDIFLEYFVFQLTKTHGIWHMLNFQDPYNACLSITILPTIISNITHINDLYIYKVLYQIIFSLSIVINFVFIRKFVNTFLAFLGTFAIVSLPTFMTDMPMLNRQEIALLFFALLLDTLFNKNLSSKIKWFLFLIFGMGLLFSHYSTTYITLGLFIGAFLIYFPLRIIKIHPTMKLIISWIDNKLGLIDNKPNLTIGMIIFLTLATIIWNVNITNTSAGIITTIDQVSKNIKETHFAKAKSDAGGYGMLNNKAPTEQSLLKSYVDTTTKYVRQFNDDTAFLDKSIYNQYPVTIASKIKLPITLLGKKLEKYNINVFSLNDQLKILYAKVVQIFIVFGFIAIFFFKKHIKNFEKEYLILSFTFLIILGVQIILPSGAIDYGILRLFQQGLILFSLPLLVGGLALFSVFDIFNRNMKIYLLSFTFVSFFLYLSGFIPEITGGYYPQLNLRNAGFYYDAYYTHKQDLVAMNWLSSNRDTEIPVQSDWFALKKIHTYEQFYSIDGLIPSVIRRNSYVYLSVSNIQTGKVIVYANGIPIYYKYSFRFLDDNKNLIYNNGESKVYR